MEVMHVVSFHSALLVQNGSDTLAASFESTSLAPTVPVFTTY